MSRQQPVQGFLRLPDLRVMSEAWLQLLLATPNKKAKANLPQLFLVDKFFGPQSIMPAAEVRL